MTYQIHFTTSLGQGDAMQRALEASGQKSILCTHDCGPNAIPGNGGSRTYLSTGGVILLPTFGPVVVLKTPAAASEAFDAAAFGALRVDVDGFEPGHAVVVVHWATDHAPAMGVLTCSDCPPGTAIWVGGEALKTKVAPQILPTPTAIHRVDFYSAQAADAWVASPQGSSYLADRLYVRLTLLP